MEVSKDSIIIYDSDGDERISLDEMYMNIALVVSKRSSCRNKKVGCVIVKDKQIVSEGYNGTPPGWHTNDCEDEHGNTKPCVSHAESNAVLKLASTTNSSRGATLYSTLRPCFSCSKQIVQAKITRVVYLEEYRKEPQAIEYLKANGVTTMKMQC